MTPLDLVAGLRGRGVAIEAVGNRLRFRPAAAVTATDRAALLTNKSELVGLLADAASLEADGTAAVLRGAWAGLTGNECHRLQAEAAAGDGGAAIVLTVVTETKP